jgi:hypothetical protein
VIISQARFPSVFNSVCAIILICLCSIPYYTGTEIGIGTVFYTGKFATVLSIALVFCSSIMLYILSKKRKIIIDGNTIEVHEKFGFKKVIFDASEIDGMTWGSLTSSGGVYGEEVTRGNKHCAITFKDGSELLIEEYDYKNCEELMAWFFSYCRYNGIINVESFEKRKKERIRRRKKN